MPIPLNKCFSNFGGDEGVRQNALIESFNGKFRDECLDQNWHTSLEDAWRIIEAWRMDYNTVRPYSSLGYLTPEEYAAAVAARPVRLRPDVFSSHDRPVRIGSNCAIK